VSDLLQGLLAAVLTEPDRDDLRLVYADALDESGDGERAEYIRLAIATEKGQGCRWEKQGRFCKAPYCFACIRRRGENGDCAPIRHYHKLARRKLALHENMGSTLWLEATDKISVWVWVNGRGNQIPPRRPVVTFSRGFAHALECQGDDWLRVADTLTSLHPIQHVTLYTEPPYVESGAWRKAGLVFISSGAPSTAVACHTAWPHITFHHLWQRS
jgi:uncharacterized protein (TIGR02996 family)